VILPPERLGAVPGLEAVEMLPHLDEQRDARRKAAFLQTTTDVANDQEMAPGGLIQVTCVPVRHRFSLDGGAPTVAQMFETTLGPLFVAPIVGRYADWGLDESGATPDDVLPVRAADPVSEVDQGGAEPWPLPAQLLCVLLNDGEPPQLRVKCREHGPAAVDLGRLASVYAKAVNERQARRQRVGKTAETDAPVVVTLQEVASWLQ